MQQSTLVRFSGGYAVAVGALLVVTNGCGGDDAPTTNPGASAGNGGAAGSSSSSGGPAATAGSDTTGTPSSGGQAPLPQPQSGSAGQGGQAGGGQAGFGGSASGSAGSAGASALDDSAALAPLHGFQLLDPCDLSNYEVEAAAGAVCPQTNGVKNQHATQKLAGDAGVTYDVTLRVRGIVERYWYEGGTLDPVSKVFYTGGVPTVGGYTSACKNKASELPFQLPAEVSPSDGCFNGFNVFAMTVSAPKQHFYLNYTADKSSDRPPHAVYSQDYTVTLAMQGQATLDFYIIGSDEHQCYNHDKVIDGVTLTSSPYIGEFLQFDVLKVTRRAP